MVDRTSVLQVTPLGLRMKLDNLPKAQSLQGAGLRLWIFKPRPQPILDLPWEKPSGQLPGNVAQWGLRARPRPTIRLHPVQVT